MSQVIKNSFMEASNIEKVYCDRNQVCLGTRCDYKFRANLFSDLDRSH